MNLVAQTIDHTQWDRLLKAHVTIHGNVDYNAFKTNEVELDDYLELLSNSNPEQLDNNGKLAFWINAYNAFTVKLIVNNYPVKSIKDIKSPWDKKFITINGKLLSLNDIEHKILRKMNEPRIHFAINCASVSCPKLLSEAYTAANLESQLQKVTLAFINSDENDISEYEVQISKIFKWFGEDFKQNGSVIDFLNTYSEISISPKAKVKFKEYNWNLND